MLKMVGSDGRMASVHLIEISFGNQEVGARQPEKNFHYS